MGDQILSCKMYISGKWVNAENNDTFDAINPGTWEVIGKVPQGSRQDARKAIEAARNAWESYRWTTAWERSALLKKIARTIEAHKEELAHILSLEQGKPYKTEALGEISAVITGFDYAAEQIKWLESSVIPVEDKNKRVYNILQPKGVYAVITPWNFPCNIPCEYITAALATGNAVVWNPASTTSMCAIKLTECIHEAGIPAGLLNMVTGKGSVVGDELVSNSGVDGIGFTGSSEVGKIIANRGAGKSMIMELGGNGPSVILNDADLDLAVPRVAAGCFFNAGQVCGATARVLVQADIYDEVVERMVAQAEAIRLGDQLDPNTTMGPMNNKSVYEKNIEHAKDAIKRGAKFLIGGGPAKQFDKGYFFEPTVVADVPLDSLYNLDETFGPVAPIIRFETNEQALEIANMDNWGLVKSVFTRDMKNAIYFGERLRSGIVNVNDSNLYWELHMPFGGVSGKQSGMGRIGGKHTMMSMCDIKTITFDINY